MQKCVRKRRMKPKFVWIDCLVQIFNNFKEKFRSSSERAQSHTFFSKFQRKLIFNHIWRGCSAYQRMNRSICRANKVQTIEQDKIKSHSDLEDSASSVVGRQTQTKWFFEVLNNVKVGPSFTFIFLLDWLLCWNMDFIVSSEKWVIVLIDAGTTDDLLSGSRAI